MSPRRKVCVLKDCRRLEWVLLDVDGWLGGCVWGRVLEEGMAEMCDSGG